MQRTVQEAGLVSDLLAAASKYESNKRNDDKNNGIPYLNGSIANYTKNLTMTFPVMCDDSISPETASMISRAIERNIVSMYQMMLAANSIKGSDGVEIIKKFYKGVDQNSSIDDIINAADKFANTNGIGESAIVDAKIREIVDEMVHELKTNQKVFPTNSFSESSLNDYLVSNRGGSTMVMESKKNDNKKNDDKKNDPDNNLIYRLRRMDLAMAKQNGENAKTQAEREKNAQRHAAQMGKIEAEKKKNDQNYEIQKAKNELAEEQEKNRINQQNYQNDVSLNVKRLVDSDVKKANELQPSLLIINYNNVSGDRVIEQKSFVAGVKTRLIPVESMDIVERLVAKNKSRLSFLNFIRATTGEIHRVSDFLLDIKQAKINAKNAAKHGMAAKMWEVLEKRSTANSYNKLKKHGNDASAITTLVISRETAEYMKKAFKFDIDQPRNAKLIIESYNLFSIVIADEINEVAKFIYDGNSNYEMLAFSFLSKENSDNKAYKQVINLMNKQGR
jgi:hypothetical protein